MVDHLKKTPLLCRIFDILNDTWTSAKSMIGIARSEEEREGFLSDKTMINPEFLERGS